MNVGPTATKKNVLEQLLDQGMVLVALDARVDGVDVPAHLGKDPQLRLNLSYRFGLPMAIDEWGVCATLTFAGIPYNCRFPWTSMFLMVSHVSGQPYLFPDDIPAELLTQAATDSATADKERPAATPQRNTGLSTRPKLTLVSSADAPAPMPAKVEVAENAIPPPSDEDSPRPRRPRRRGHLRLVK